MIIYRVTNKINGKIYIGQSVNSTTHRWYGHVHCAKNKSTTTALAGAIRKYGRDGFDIDILDTASTQDELNIKEWFFAGMLNSYAPNGYNLAECGFRMAKHAETIEKTSKDWVLLSPDDKIVRIHNLNAFCRDRGLPTGRMASVVKNETFSCCGWRNARRRNRTYHLVNVETGQQKDVIQAHGAIKEAAPSMGILSSNLANVIRGSIREHKGWVLQGESFSSVAPEFDGDELAPKPRFKRRHTEETVLRISGGIPKRLLNNTEMRIYEFTNTSRFTTQMGLHIALVINVLKGKTRAKHKRWSLPTMPIKRFIVKRENESEIEVFDGEIKAFCRANGVKSPQYFFKLLNGKRDSYAGWVLVKAYTPSAEGLEVVKLKQYDLPE